MGKRAHGLAARTQSGRGVAVAFWGGDEDAKAGCQAQVHTSAQVQVTGSSASASWNPKRSTISCLEVSLRELRDAAEKHKGTQFSLKSSSTAAYTSTVALTSEAVSESQRGLRFECVLGLVDPLIPVQVDGGSVGSVMRCPRTKLSIKANKPEVLKHLHSLKLQARATSR